MIPSGATPLDMAVKAQNIKCIILLSLRGGLLNLPVRAQDQRYLDAAQNWIAARQVLRMQQIDDATGNNTFPKTLLQIIKDYEYCEKNTCARSRYFFRTALTICRTFSSVFKGPDSDINFFITSTSTVQEFDEQCISLKKYDYELITGDRYGRHALSHAAYHGNVQLIQHIYDKGGPKLLVLGDTFGWTPMHHAVSNSHYDAVYTLIKLDSPINFLAVNDSSKPLPLQPFGATPLDIAIRTRKVAIIILLILNGAIKGDIPMDELDTLALDQAVDSIAQARSKWKKNLVFISRDGDFLTILTDFLYENNLQTGDIVG